MEMYEITNDCKIEYGTGIRVPAPTRVRREDVELMRKTLIT